MNYKNSWNRKSLICYGLCFSSSIMSMSSFSSPAKTISETYEKEY